MKKIAIVLITILGSVTSVLMQENIEIEKIKIVNPQKIDRNADIQSGSVIVKVTENANTIVKIGLSERGVALIDFPVDDPVYKIHPGDENFVTVGCDKRENAGNRCFNSPTDAIVLRPGKSFHSLGTKNASATLITIQRLSGIVVTLIVYPVKYINENTNYVSFRYSLRDAVESRRRAGLASNLKPNVLPLDLSKSVVDRKKDKNSSQARSEKILNAKFENKDKFKEKNVNQNTNENNSVNDLEARLVNEIQNAAINTDRLHFSKPTFGLSLARMPFNQARLKDVTVDVIAVRNTLSFPIRLVPDQPNLVVESRTNKKSSINIQKINILHVATTVNEMDVLEPGKIYYFAFAFQSPIMGVKQVLRVSFAHRVAADAPASLVLSSSFKGK